MITIRQGASSRRRILLVIAAVAQILCAIALLDGLAVAPATSAFQMPATNMMPRRSVVSCSPPAVTPLAAPRSRHPHPGDSFSSQFWLIRPSSSSSLAMNSFLETPSSKHSEKQGLVSKILCRSAWALVALTMTLASSPPTALAAAAATTTTAEHLHMGQKIANFFRQFGIPDLAVLAIISALPVVELRGAVPVGIWMGLPITTVLPVCVAGNMMPIVPLLYLLRNPTLKKVMRPVLQRAESKTSELGMGSAEKRWASLAAFVGIPLPGTGAWTGAMGAFLLNMPLVQALTSIFAGVVAAGVIMSAIVLAGKKGGIAALAALFILTGMEFFKGGDDSKKKINKGDEEVSI